MSETYLALASFAQTWGLAYFVLVFLSVLVWTFWPSRKAEFEKTALIPLSED